jgi:Uma2 family endonuclease
MAYAPCLLVEVLSSEHRTQRPLAEAERVSPIASLQSYLVVSRAARHVTWHWRDPAA